MNETMATRLRSSRTAACCGMLLAVWACGGDGDSSGNEASSGSSSTSASDSAGPGGTGGTGGGGSDPATTTSASGGSGGGETGPPPKAYRSIATGHEHSCAIDIEGRMWCWGYGNKGQLADGNASNKSQRRARPFPTQDGASDMGPKVDLRWTRIAAGRWHGCGISVEGELYCWGSDKFGAVGLAGRNQTNPIVAVPWQVTVAGTSHNDWSDVAVATNVGPDHVTESSHSCAIRSGQLYCWGNNSAGQLGLGDQNQRDEPSRVGNDSDWQAISAGDEHSCGIRAGQLYCWGNSNEGKLGLGPSVGPHTTQPTRVGTQNNWQTVAVGSNHSCAIDSADNLYCWGNGSSGQLGLGTTDSSDIPLQVPGKWQQVEVGASRENRSTKIDAFSCGIQTDGSAWCWGSGSFGQLGIGNGQEVIPSPSQVGTDTDHAQLAVGSRHACTLRDMGTASEDDDTIWCWGSLSQGQTGHGLVGEHHWFTPIGSTSFAQVDAGAEASCGVRHDGTLWCWGRGSYGVLGSGAGANSDQPLQVGSDSDWAAVEVGQQYACALKSDTSLWCWGQTSDGSIQLPAAVGPSTGWTLPSCGGMVAKSGDNISSCCGVVSGSLYCWGNNAHGQLGTGDRLAVASPTPIGSDSQWQKASVSAAAYPRVSTCATKTDGSLWCWGNNKGQLGLGDTVERLTPTQVGQDTDWTQVATGSLSTCAIKTDGRLYCWGKSGWVANFGANPGHLPVLLQASSNSDNQFAAHDWSQIQLSYQHGCGIRGLSGKRSIWCWGKAYEGALAQGYGIISLSEPGLIAATIDFAAVSVGGRAASTTGRSHTLARSANGQAYASGDNLYGQLGVKAFERTPKRILNPAP